MTLTPVKKQTKKEPYNPDKGILDITIDSISPDEGLAIPYGLAEVQLTTVYRLDG